MNKYLVTINWESEDIEVWAKNKDEAEEIAKDKCNGYPNMDLSHVERIS